MIEVQHRIAYGEYSVLCLRLIVDMFQYIVKPWVFHDEFLHKDAMNQIEVLMDDMLFTLILLVGK